MESRWASDAVRLIVSILIAQSAGVVGSFFTAPAIPTWYETLVKPSFTPPNWVIGPVWVVLYTLIGIALFLVWRMGLEKREVRIAIGIFAVQLVLNALWSWAFFGLQSPLTGLIVIIVLWVAILLNIVIFYRISKTAGLLLIPYILWVSFATALNYSIWILNP